MEMLEKFDKSFGDVRKFLYLVQPEECTFEKIQDVPNYFSEVFPLFIGLVCAEYVALAMKRESPRLAESLNSLAHGILSETFKILTMGVDFAYYWAHRASHEVNFLWAQHQIHHSSEDFNIAVAVRHPITHGWINSFFYLPLALLIPPPHCLAHQQFSNLYQGWLHTSLVGTLGPLEFIFNTPSHHKVHHGCNLYVLDKNFGGLLIIWDRIFGTFQAAREDEELVYGIVFQHESHNPVWQMYYRWPALFRWSRMQSTWADAFRAVFYGPSWRPGSPRTGADVDKVDIKPRPKFVIMLPKWLQAYILLHFFMVCLVFQEFALKKGTLDEITIVMTVSHLVLSLTSIGLLSEGNPWGSYFELFRCSVTFLILPTPNSQKDYWLKGVVNLYFIPSAVLWIVYVLYQGIVGAKKPEGIMETDNCDECSRQEDEAHREILYGDDDGDHRTPKIFNWKTGKITNNRSQFGRSRRGSGEENHPYLVESKSFVDQRNLN
ncbi:alkylglycerol monooxygenase isoform X2 [Folsomia candida]|uniref:alkylglycerol monooxygenase isoform X2 n=1 Tax=Folsomia candida TaxID=158441 RepID=UPI00160552F5|nr:alkylglycerol monooxygenase isoform X2 [Folsomia candida]